jgi:hypothetical protein
MFLLLIHDYLSRNMLVKCFVDFKKTILQLERPIRQIEWQNDRCTWMPISHKAVAVPWATLEVILERNTFFVPKGMLLSTTAVAKPLPSTSRTLSFGYFCINSSPLLLSVFA